MTIKIKITLMLLLISSYCFSNRNIKVFDPNRKKHYIEKGWTYDETDSTLTKYDINKSPNKAYAVYSEIIRLPDSVNEGSYWLINNTTQDSVMLMVNHFRNLYGPNFYWSGNNYLIHEFEDYSNLIINMVNLGSFEKELSIEGTIPFLRKESAEFYDKKNKILIFFSTKRQENGYGPALMKLDVNTKQITQLFTFENKIYPSYEMFQNIEIDPNHRLFKIEYYDSEVRTMYKKDIKY